MLAEECPPDVVPVLELMLAFEAAKNALAQAKERAQQAVTAKLSAARPAQDEMLRLDALAAEGYWGILISPNASLFRHKREAAAAREADELNDLHQAGIALAHANVVNCDMAATALHKAVMSGGGGGGAQSGGVDDAWMAARKGAGGGGGAQSGGGARSGSGNGYGAWSGGGGGGPQSRGAATGRGAGARISPGRGGRGGGDGPQSRGAAVGRGGGARGAGPGRGARGRGVRPGRAAAGKAEKRRSPEPFEEPRAYLEVEEPGAGSLLGGQGGRGELEAGGTPLTFDPGRTRHPPNTEVWSSTHPPPDSEVRSSTRRPPGH